MRHISENRQKWINCIILALLMFVGLGFCSSNKSLYLSAITEALGIKRSVFSLATSLRFITTAAASLFFGALVSRFGTKKLMMSGIMCLAGSMFLNSVSCGMTLFFISEALCGIGFAFAGTTMASCVVNRWFSEKRGTVTGAVLCANGIGGAVAAQIVSPLIFNAENVFGYRDAYRLIIVMLMLLLLIVAVFFRQKTKKGMAVSSDSKKTNDSWHGISYSSAVKQPYFYGAAICIFLTGMILQGMVGVSSTHLGDVGFDADFIALIASASSLLLTGSKFVSGFLFDRFGLRVTISISVFAAAVTMFSLAFMTVSSFGKVLAAIYAVTNAVALPLETVMLPLYAAELFGNMAYDRILGVFVSCNVAGYACGIPLVNLIFDICGSYTPAFFAMGIAMIFVMIAMQFVINSAHKKRRETESI